MEDLILSQFTASGIAVWLLQKIKGSPKIPQVTQQTDGLNRVLAVLLAALTAGGITYGYAWEAGTLTFSIQGLTVTGILSFLWHIATSLTAQEVIYRGAVKKPEQDK